MSDVGGLLNNIEINIILCRLEAIEDCLMTKCSVDQEYFNNVFMESVRKIGLNLRNNGVDKNEG